MPSLLYFAAMITITLGVEIIRGPLNVSNAVIGGTASFECILSSASQFPRWNINGIDFTVTNLPTGFEFESHSYSKVLTVNPVRQEMNNSVFSCFLLFLYERKESARATLVIKQHSVYTQHTLTPATSASIPPSAATVALVSTSGVYSHTHTSNLPQPKPSAKDSSRHLILAAALSAAVIVSLSVPIVAFWMYKTKSKYKYSNSEQHRKKEYEKVVGEVTKKHVLHNNPVYENPMTMKLEV